MERVFLDTNVLLYADDLDAGDKRERALDIIDRHVREGSAVVSTQVLQEFFVIATRKLGVAAPIARRKVEILGSLDVVTIDHDMVLAAIDLHRLHSFSFWDALIVRAASSGGCVRLLSEDMQDGRLVDGIRIENPFSGS